MEDYQNFSYWFSDTIVDPNGKTVSDINRGIKRICTDLVGILNRPENVNNNRFIINHDMNGQPDAVAYIKYNNHNLWWFVCLSNNLENPTEDFINDKMYYVFDKQVLSDYATQEIESSNSQNTESKIGKIVELN